MKKSFLKLAISVLAVVLLGSCSKINERLDNLDKRIDGIENEKIAAISDQIANINSSIADLGQIRSDISSLKQSASDHSVDIFNLEEADRALKDRIVNLEDYVDAVLPNYAEKEWVEATFSTLAQYEATCDTIAKIDARIGALDAKLSKDIKATADSLTKWVNKTFEGYYTAAQMDAKLTQMRSDIDSAKAVNKITDAKADSLAGELAKVKPEVDSAKANIRKEYRIAIETAIKASEGKLTKEITDKIATVNTAVTNLTGRVDKIERDVKALTGRVDKIEQMIQSVSVIPFYSDGSVDVKDSILYLDIVVEPAATVASLTKDNLTVLVNEVKTKSVDVDTVSITKYKADSANGTITARADISSKLPVETGKALTIAVNVKNGLSDYTTKFYPVALSSNVTVKDETDTTKVTITADKEFPEPASGNIVVNDGFKDSKPTAITVEGIGTVIFDKDATAKIKANAQEAGATSVVFKVEDVTTTKPVPNADVVLEVTMKTVDENGTEVYSKDKAGGEVTIQIPMAEDVVYVNSVTLVNADGDPIEGGVVPGSEKIENGILTFKVNHFSKYAVDYVKRSQFVAVTGVSLSKTALSLEVGGSDALIATITPTNATNKNVTWRSSDEAVATVGNDGKVTATGAGTTTITVTTVDGGETATCTVTVSNPVVNVTGVTLNKDTLNLAVGGNETLISTVSPANATNKNVTWSSSDEAVATVDANGKVTAVTRGTATITVTTVDGGKTAICEVTVSNPVVNVTGVTLNKDTLNLAVGGNETLIPTVSPANATNKNVTWRSSDEAVATVGNDGKVTAIAAGTATITVTTEDGGKTATCAVTVTTPVTGVSLNKTALSLTVGGSETLTATIVPTNATNKNVTWSSSDEAVATVGNDGKVTAVSAGNATITVTTVDGGKTATCAVTVATPVTGVSLSKTALSLEVGGSDALIATITPTNATNKNVTWSSSNTSVATVGNDGKVTAVSAGNATITVTTVDGGKTATCAVTVATPVTGVSLNKTALSLTVGGTGTLTATIAPTNATNKNVTWSSSNTAVATVGNDGKVTAVAHGTAIITVTTIDGSKTATCAVTVTTGTGFGEYGEGGNI